MNGGFSWVHWVAANITSTSVEENASQNHPDFVQGLNSWVSLQGGTAEPRPLRLLRRHGAPQRAPHLRAACLCPGYHAGSQGWLLVPRDVPPDGGARFGSGYHKGDLSELKRPRWERKRGRSASSLHRSGWPERPGPSLRSWARRWQR